jgi:hypothetical protein
VYIVISVTQEFWQTSFKMGSNADGKGSICRDAEVLFCESSNMWQ